MKIIKTIDVLMKNIRTSALFIFGLLMGQNIHAQANFLIWPIYPVIESHEKAVPVWLENVGDDSSMVQIRVFKWTQNNGQDEYENQQEVIASPPIVKIQAASKQMIRLVKSNSNAAESKEHSYRIIIDELPFDMDANKERSQVSFKMRYSLPLFVYGKGLGSGRTDESIKLNAKNPLAKPILKWSVVSELNKEYLKIDNIGLMSVRISGFKNNQKEYKSLSGSNTFGYVLANSAFNFELSPELKKALFSDTPIYAIVGNTQDPIIISKK